MTDRIDDGLPGIDGPRSLAPDLRARLEQAVVDASAKLGDRDPDEDPSLWSIDGPREVPPALRARLHQTMTMRRRAAPVWLTRGVAAATALIMVTSSILVASRSEDTQGRPPILAAPGDQGPEAPPRSIPSEPQKRPPGSLQAFGSSSEFLAYVRGEALKVVGPYGLQGSGFSFHGDAVAVPGMAAGSGSAGGGNGDAGTSVRPPAMMSAPSTQDRAPFSTTNVQEAGVDELDMVKTDGQILAVLSGLRLWLLDVGDGTPERLGSIRVPSGNGIFLLEDKVVVIGFSPMTDAHAKKIGSAPGRQWTKLTVVDISDPADPSIASSLNLEGSYTGARLAGGVVRLVLRSDMLGPAPALYRGNWTKKVVEQFEEKNKDIVRRSAVGDWVPHFELKVPGLPAEVGHVHDALAISKPPEKSDLGMTTVLSIDPDDPQPDGAKSVIGAGEIVYASTTSLYVTSSVNDPAFGIARPSRRAAPKEPITRIHKFDITDPETATYAGSGWVPGRLLNQFSMSEHDGYLRVASTVEVWEPRPRSSSVVTVLGQEGLKLARVGKVGNLGKGERIYAVRFIGDKAYVVTFRQVDPLYVIDLSTPAAPKVLGELKIPGYSAYLHPIDEDHLIGVGRQANARGVTGGVQLSLFDVSDPSDPRRLDAKVVGKYAYSEVESDHHGFLYWDPKRLLVVPTTIEDYENGEHWTGAVAVTVGPVDGFGETTRLTHMNRVDEEEFYPGIRRSLVVGGHLLTISVAGILSSDIDTLDERSWTAFRS